MLIILFNPGHNVASYNMNRQVGILPKKLLAISLLFNKKQYYLVISKPTTSGGLILS
jgi:hypothetical protein